MLTTFPLFATHDSSVSVTSHSGVSPPSPCKPLAPRNAIAAINAKRKLQREESNPKINKASRPTRT
jgi:hypothetical protein